MGMFSMTSDALTKIFKKIKDNLNEKDYSLIPQHYNLTLFISS